MKEWNHYVFGNIFKMKHRIIRRLKGISKKLLIEDNSRLLGLRDQLWDDTSCWLIRKRLTGTIKWRWNGSPWVIVIVDSFIKPVWLVEGRIGSQLYWIMMAPGFMMIMLCMPLSSNSMPPYMLPLVMRTPPFKPCTRSPWSLRLICNLWGCGLNLGNSLFTVQYAEFKGPRVWQVPSSIL